MTRVGWLLTALLGLLLIVAWYFLLFAPTSEDIEDVRAQTEQVEAETTQQRQRAAVLRQVREEAPEAESQLAFGRSLIPDDPAMPALFRQMQQAADESGARLTTIVPTSPSAIDFEGGQFASIGVSMTVEGSFFQLVDMARRIEDPTITARALRWESAQIQVGEFPTLDVVLNGHVFARTVSDLPQVEPPLDEEPDEADTDPDADPAVDPDLPGDDDEADQ